MKVILSTGDSINILGPVTEITDKGFLISQTEYRAEINGSVGTVSLDELENAEFPPEVVEQMAALFDDSLRRVRESWSRLKKVRAQ
jgi:hypothetical protein